MKRQEPAAPAEKASVPAAPADSATPARAEAQRRLGLLLSALEHVAEQDGPEFAIIAAAEANLTLAKAQVYLARHTTRSVTSALRIVVDEAPTTRP